ncbi:MAG: ROK family protein [Verrucomicrobiae bacterium]|nr:ROK family protein [Verrucomicrobiae bacterium]MCP5524985.1 ROK family protein [Verrucomicrobiales bacterium]
MRHTGPFLVAPRTTPVLEPAFRPAVLARRAFHAAALASGHPVPVEMALEQSDGSIVRSAIDLLPPDHPGAGANPFFLERHLKFLLWSRGGHRIYIAGPDDQADTLGRFYALQTTGRFDAQMMGDRIYGRPFEVVHCALEELPPEKQRLQKLGGHWDGCRIGFDLGGSDRKVAAVQDGKVLFSEETVWDPIPQGDPRWHFEQIMDSLRTAASHLPRVDAIGGSAAGVYVNNRVRVASLFKGVPPDLFRSQVKDIFLELQREWKGVPFEVVNDGEVTALAGAMQLGDGGVLGIALGTSTAGGYVTPEGGLTSWLNELAFVPVDYQPQATVDEWSQDAGCAAKYFSQQCVGRLVGVAGITVEPEMSLPEILKQVQALMAEGDYRARKIYETLGTFLGYTLANFADFYELRHVLILGRVTSGEGGQIILDRAGEILRDEFPELGKQVQLHLPSEKEKRHGQAMAAASLPELKRA